MNQRPFDTAFPANHYKKQNPGQKQGGADAAMAWLYCGIRLTLGMIFLYSGGSKILNPQSFATIIEAYGLIPDATILPVAIGLSFLEVIAGAGLILDIRWSLGIIAGLLILFMAILGYGIHMGLDVDCGCFGPDDLEAEAYHSLRPALYRDVVMMAGISYLFFWRWRKAIRPFKLSVIVQRITNKHRRNQQ